MKAILLTGTASLHAMLRWADLLASGSTRGVCADQQALTCPHDSVLLHGSLEYACKPFAVLPAGLFMSLACYLVKHFDSCTHSCTRPCGR